MIVEKEIVFSVSNFKKLKFYQSLGYDVKEIKTNFLIKTNHLPTGSHFRVNIKCDYCENTSIQEYRRHFEITNKFGAYACSACRGKHIQKSVQIKYNVDNVFQLEEVKEQSRNTCKEKYGSEWYTRTQFYIDSLMANYGVINVFQMENVKQKIVDFNIKTYGVEHPMLNEEYKEKMKIIFLETLGYDHPMKHPDIIKKSNDTKDYNGNRIPDEMMVGFLKYRREVVKLTKRNKKKMLENWDGYDYYDNEYIKDNYKLNHLDGNYPQIDHKISMYYGFNNNISSEDLSDISNLCFTKRIINIKKGKNSYFD